MGKIRTWVANKFQSEIIQHANNLLWKEFGEELGKKVDLKNDPVEKSWKSLGTVMKEQLTTERQDIQENAYEKYFNSPTFGGIIDQQFFYIVGGGLSWHTESPELKIIWERFWLNNKMEWKHRQIVNMVEIEEERLLRYFCNYETGNVSLREVEASDIVEVITDPEDIERIVCYNITNTETVKNYFLLDIGCREWWEKRDEVFGRTFEKNKVDAVAGYIIGSEKLPEQFGQYIAPGKIGNIKRTMTKHQRILPWCTTFEDAVDSRQKLHKYRSSIVAIMKLKQATKGMLEAGMTGAKKVPPPMTLLGLREGEDFEFKSPNLEASDAASDLRLFRLMPCMGSGTPEHIAAQDYSNANYSSTVESGSSWTQKIKFRQSYYEYCMFKPMYDLVIDVALAADLVDKTVMVRRYITRQDVEKIKKLVLQEAVKDKSCYLGLLESATGGKKELKIGKIKLIGREIIEQAFYASAVRFFEREESEHDSILKRVLINLEIPTEDVEFTFSFPDPVKADVKKQSDAFSVQVNDLSLPKEVAIRQLGYDIDEIKEIWAREKVENEEDLQKQKEEQVNAFAKGQMIPGMTAADLRKMVNQGKQEE